MSPGLENTLFHGCSCTGHLQLYRQRRSGEKWCSECIKNSAVVMKAAALIHLAHGTEKQAAVPVKKEAAPVWDKTPIPHAAGDFSFTHEMALLNLLV